MMMFQKLSPQEEFANLALRLRAKGITDFSIFATLEQVSRRLFVDGKWSDIVYLNTTIPIECGEYIERLDEQFILLSALELQKKHRVLEIGTGSGFTAAIMARLAGRVTTVDRYKTLCNLARQRFRSLKIDNIIAKQADACQVTASIGAFDRVIVWPSLPREPKEFLDLLTGNGVLIAPVGESGSEQTIIRYNKTGSRFEKTNICHVRYQPFVEGMAAFL